MTKWDSAETRITPLESQKEPREIKKEEYLNRLSECDRRNLSALVQSFEDTLRDDQREGTLVAVGSSVSGKRPRYTLPGKLQDIDALALFENKVGEPIPDRRLPAQLKVFAIFRQLTSRMVEKTKLLEIEKEQEPFPSMGVPDSVFHSGSVTLKSRDSKGMPIELVISNGPGTDPKTHISQGASYVFLARVVRNGDSS